MPIYFAKEPEFDFTVHDGRFEWQIFCRNREIHDGRAGIVGNVKVYGTMVQRDGDFVVMAERIEFLEE
jgi:hypothetical protein